MNADELLPFYLHATRPTDSVGGSILLSWSKFADFLGDLDMCDIQPSHLVDFQRKLLWEPYQDGKFYSPHSVDQFLRRVRQVLLWAFDHGFFPQDLTSQLCLTRPTTQPPKLLTWTELQRLSQIPDQHTPMGLRDALLLALLIETDLSLAAIVALPLDAKPDLEDLSFGLLDAYRQSARPQWARADCDVLLLTPRGRPMAQVTAVARLNHLCQQAGLGRVAPKLLRRSYLAYLKLQSQIRHSSFS